MDDLLIKLSRRAIDERRDWHRFGLMSEELSDKDRRIIARKLRFDEAAGRRGEFTRLSPSERKAITGRSLRGIGKKVDLYDRVGAYFTKDYKTAITGKSSSPVEVSWRGRKTLSGGPNSTVMIPAYAKTISEKPSKSRVTSEYIPRRKSRLFKDIPGVHPKAGIGKLKSRRVLNINKAVNYSNRSGHIHPGTDLPYTTIGAVKSFLTKKLFGSRKAPDPADDAKQMLHIMKRTKHKSPGARIATLSKADIDVFEAELNRGSKLKKPVGKLYTEVFNPDSGVSTVNKFFKNRHGTIGVNTTHFTKPNLNWVPKRVAKGIGKFKF